MPPRRRGTAPAKPTPRTKPGRTPVWLWLIAGTAVGAVLAVALFFQDAPRGGGRDTGADDQPVANKTKPAPPIKEQDYRLEDLHDPAGDHRQQAATTVGADAAKATTPQAKTKPETRPKRQAIASPKPLVAPQTAAKRATRVSKAHSGRRSWLQAGAFRSAAQADNLKARLILSGLPVRVVRARVKGKTWYRVRIGPYRDNADLTRAKGKLRRQKIQVTVIRERG